MLLQITQFLGIFPKLFLSNLIDNFERLDIEFWERTLHIIEGRFKINRQRSSLSPGVQCWNQGFRSGTVISNDKTRTVDDWSGVNKIGKWVFDEEYCFAAADKDIIKSYVLFGIRLPLNWHMCPSLQLLNAFSLKTLVLNVMWWVVEKEQMRKSMPRTLSQGLWTLSEWPLLINM